MLVPCTMCSRHIRASEFICPFCAHPNPPATSGSSSHLASAALVLFGAGLSACRSGAVYGGPPPDAGASTPSRAESGGPGPAPIYGGPPPEVLRVAVNGPLGLAARAPIS